jgi:hypothetical protein
LVCSQLIREFNLEISGVLHVGANQCEEEKIYTDNGIPMNKVVWLEANPEVVDQKQREKPHLKILRAGVDAVDGVKKELNVANNLDSSSFLPLGTTLIRSWLASRILLDVSLTRVFAFENSHTQDRTSRD